MLQSPSRESKRFTPPRAIGCDEAEALISRRVDGELETENAPVLDAHLAECGNCRASSETWSDHSELLDETLTGLWQRSPHKPAKQAPPRPRAIKRCLWVPIGMLASQVLAFVGLTIYFILFGLPVQAPRDNLRTEAEQSRTESRHDRPGTPDAAPLPVAASVQLALPAQSSPEGRSAPRADVNVSAQPPKLVLAAPQSVDMPRHEIDNLSLQYRIVAKDDSVESAGRIVVLGDVASERAIIRIIDSRGGIQDVARQDVDTVLAPPLRELVRRFLHECARPETRERLEAAQRRSSEDLARLAAPPASR